MRGEPRNVTFRKFHFGNRFQKVRQLFNEHVTLLETLALTCEYKECNFQSRITRQNYPQSNGQTEKNEGTSNDVMQKYNEPDQGYTNYTC